MSIRATGKKKWKTLTIQDKTKIISSYQGHIAEVLNNDTYYDLLEQKKNHAILINLIKSNQHKIKLQR